MRWCFVPQARIGELLLLGTEVSLPPLVWPMQLSVGCLKQAVSSHLPVFLCLLPLHFDFGVSAVVLWGCLHVKEDVLVTFPKWQQLVVVLWEG